MQANTQSRIIVWSIAWTVVFGTIAILNMASDALALQPGVSTSVYVFAILGALGLIGIAIGMWGGRSK